MNCDRLAPFYRAMERFTAGGKLQRCRLAFLGEIPVPRNVLLAGEGHGRFLPECVRRFPDARIVVVDSSQRMLGIARSKVESTQVEFVQTDLLEWQAPLNQFDLIVTNFFLDCFPPDGLAAVVRKLGKLAASEADWLLADFEIAPAGPARWRSRLIVAALYRFFGIVTGLKANTLVPPEKNLANAGFILQRRETYDWGLLKSEWWRRTSA
ncbi:MAG: class I SAM-dependent methyltransferase [Verrucomicrobiota bacterium]